MLQNAIAAAKAGQRQHARDLFEVITGQDPGCLVAWLWLSDLHDNLADRINALDHALTLQPNNPTVQARRDQLAERLQQQSALPVKAVADPQQMASHVQAQQLYRQAWMHKKEGKPEEALRELYKLVTIENQHVKVWLLIADLESSSAGQIRALERAQELQLANEAVQSRLERLKQAEQNPLQRGIALEECGEMEQAQAVYRSVAVRSRSATERLEANRRIADLKLRQESHQLRAVSPTLNLLRLTAGPALFFGLLIFIQGGLNPLKLPLVSLLGEVSVTSGSLLVTVTGLRPLHPKWIALFGQPGTGEEAEIRKGLRLLGWGLLAAPYLIFLIEAVHRLVLLLSTQIYLYP